MHVRMRVCASVHTRVRVGHAEAFGVLSYCGHSFDSTRGYEGVAAAVLRVLDQISLCSPPACAALSLGLPSPLPSPPSTVGQPSQAWLEVVCF